MDCASVLVKLVVGMDRLIPATKRRKFVLIARERADDHVAQLMLTCQRTTKRESTIMAIKLFDLGRLASFEDVIDFLDGFARKTDFNKDVQDAHDLVDDNGTVHVQWDMGCRLGLIPGEDMWVVL